MTATDRTTGPGRATASHSASAAHAIVSVLVIDADAEMRELYRRSLVARGARVHEAVDGRDGIVQAYSVRPDVIIVDARLPYVDGMQLCRLLRQDLPTSTLRIVAVTSNSSPEHFRRFRDCGADAVFIKPVQLEELAAAVRPAPVTSPTVVDSPPEPAVEPLRPRAKTRLHERYMSTTPPERPPHLHCPQCDGVLQYDHSNVGGVSDRHPEQWDYFLCPRHGAFQYRHRTRKLRPAS